MDSADSPTSARNHRVSEPVPSFLETLLAPCLIFTPGRAARRLSAGSRVAVCVCVAAWLTLFATLVVALRVWDGTVEFRRAPGMASRDRQERSVVEVWRAWHERRVIGPLELLFGAAWLGAAGLAGVMAWLLLPYVHRHGSGWASYRRAYCVVASGTGVLALLTVAIGVPIVTGRNRQDDLGPLFSDPDWALVHVIFWLAWGCLLFGWLYLAARGATGPETPVAPPPRCEGCGYDLTHQAADGRCTECGLNVADSLTPGLRRPGCQWQRSGDPRAWGQTTVSLILSPARFYGRLKLRTPPEDADRFARWQYPAIGLYTAGVSFVLLWVLTLTAGPAPGGLLCFVPLLFFFLIPLCGWVLHHVLGALVTSWLVVRGLLPDMRWARCVFAYETAYLWVFALYGSVLVASFTFFGPWMTRWTPFTLVGIGPIRMPPEAAAMLFGCALILAGWFRRYRIAVRNVRWSNY